MGERNLTCQHVTILQHIITSKYRISRPIRRTLIFSLDILEKNDDGCILILVIYWKKTGFLHTKISNHNIIYSSQKPRKLSSLPLKSSSWLFLLDASLSSYKRCTGIYKFGNNTYPRRIRRRSNLGHIFRGKSASYGPGNMVCNANNMQLMFYCYSKWAGVTCFACQSILNYQIHSQMVSSDPFVIFVPFRVASGATLLWWYSDQAVYSMEY